MSGGGGGGGWGGDGGGGCGDGGDGGGGTGSKTCTFFTVPPPIQNYQTLMNNDTICICSWFNFF